MCSAPAGPRLRWRPAGRIGKQVRLLLGPLTLTTSYPKTHYSLCTTYHSLLTTQALFLRHGATTRHDSEGAAASFSPGPEWRAAAQPPFGGVLLTTHYLLLTTYYLLLRKVWHKSKTDKTHCGFESKTGVM